MSNTLRKTDILKTCWKSKFPGKKMKKCASFKEQKIVYKVNSWKCLFWYYCQQLPFVYKAILIFLVICFHQETRGFYQSSVRNDVNFRDMFSKISWLKIKISKNWDLYIVEKRALATRTVISSCHWKSHVPFGLQKKKHVEKDAIRNNNKWAI